MTEAGSLNSKTYESYNIDHYLRPAPEPQFPTGRLDGKYHCHDLTPVIGREYLDAQLEDVLQSEAQLRDLAIIVSQRGVVFFKNQTLLPNSQKVLAQKLGELTGKPSTSSLHIHPMMNQGLEEGLADNQISVISSQHGRERYKERFTLPLGRSKAKKSAVRFWHNDTSFERVPSDYTVLKVIDTPVVGGDTLWASGYEMYNRLSNPFQTFFETLTATFSQPLYKETARTKQLQLIYGERGSPSNNTTEFEAVHPLIRTNPVTGHKSIFGWGQHAAFINGVTEAESEMLTRMIQRILTENHDLQIRYRWGINDVAIWDNRSNFHTATYDHDGPRIGVRAVGIGEPPFLSL